MTQARQWMRKEMDNQGKERQRRKGGRSGLGAGVADKAEFEAVGVEIGDQAEWGVRFVHGP